MNSLDPALAKYLSASKQDILDEYHGKSKKKKSKRKTADAGMPGLVIADDSAEDGWRRADDEDEDMTPVVEHRVSSVFKPVASTSAAKEPAQEQEPDADDEAPVVVGGIVDEAPTASSSSAFAQKRLQGGLQTAAQLREENKRRKAAAQAEKEAAAAAKAAAQRAGNVDDNPDEETVYRDASGKRIDTKAAKAEQARQRRAELEKEMQKMEWGKGLVQREDRERKQRELEDMANRPFARYADDERMNDELREQQRWNDPAARFLTGDSKKKKSKGPQKPTYKGPMPPPNRFNIPPGYRWDGVDRSNGFERELMQAGNKRKIAEAQARVFSTEDM